MGRGSRSSRYTAAAAAAAELKVLKSRPSCSLGSRGVRIRATKQCGHLNQE